MSADFYSKGVRVKAAKNNRTIATANSESEAEIITKALNYYFGTSYTKNDALEMMHQNTANVLGKIVDFCEINELDAHEIIDTMKECKEELEVESLVVSLRDVCGFDGPK